MLPGAEASLAVDALVISTIAVVAGAVLLVACCAGGDKDSQPAARPTQPAAARGQASHEQQGANKQTKPAASAQVKTPAPPKAAPNYDRDKPTVSVPAKSKVSEPGYLNTPVPIVPNRPDALQAPRYFNVHAGERQLAARKPVRFSVKEAIGNLKRDLQKRKITPDRLTLEEVVGKGEFGLVYKGKLKGTDMTNPTEVAVKTVHGEDCSPDDLKAFLEEVMRMTGFSHQNVQSTIGLVVKDEMPYAVMPFMKNGDLRAFVLSPDRNFRIKNLLEFGLQVALGMEYLAKKKFVHRDLAARNCMVDENLQVKVADFGLSRDIFGSDYYRMKNTSTTPLPVRWMAPESFDGRIYTTQTDVWSFGVVLWELLTRGMTPYYNMASKEAIDYVKAGKRLETPAGCPSKISNLMLRCWDIEPNKRPGFNQSVIILKNLLTPSQS